MGTDAKCQGSLEAILKDGYHSKFLVLIYFRWSFLNLGHEHF